MDRKKFWSAKDDRGHKKRMTHNNPHEDYSLIDQWHGVSKEPHYEVQESQPLQIHPNESSGVQSAMRGARVMKDKSTTMNPEPQQKESQFEGTQTEERLQERIVYNVNEEYNMKSKSTQATCDYEEEEWKRWHQDLLEEEQEQRKVHNLTVDNRNAATLAERERKILERANKSKILGDLLVAHGIVHQERQDFINMIQERGMFGETSDNNDAAGFKYLLDEIEKCNISQMEFKRFAAKEAEREENRFREESEKLMAMQDEMQMEKDRQKRERNHQYSLDLQAQIADNARRRQAERESEQAREQDQFDGDQERRQVQQFVVPESVSNPDSDVGKCDDNSRQSEKQQTLEDDAELEEERKKRERNQQYSWDLRAQIADNARRRQAEREYEQAEFERNEQWRDKTEERKKVMEEKNVNVGGWDEEPVVRKRDAPEGNFTEQR